MQLFTIGTVLLNEDGTHKRDSDGNEIDAYSTLDIMSFAREFIIYYHPSKIRCHCQVIVAHHMVVIHRCVDWI